MTTNVSNVYNAMVVIIEAQLTAYKKLPNPYDPEENSSLRLKKGYGLAFGAGVNTNRYMNCKIAVDRQFSILLVRQVSKSDHDITGHATLEKSMLEDEFLLIKAFEQDPTLGGVAVKTRFVGDTGIEFLEGDRNKYLVLEMELGSEYFEDLN